MAFTRESTGPDLGGLLTIWRARAGLDQRQATGRLEPPPTVGALSMWERGRRRPPWHRIAELDHVYGADGALFDLAAALDTPHGLAGRRVWSHNFLGEPGPVWAWLRPAVPGTLQAVLRWGAFRIDLRHQCTARGVFIAVPTSTPNPAAWVILREPGWVDFGRGRPPAELDIPVFEALDHATVTDLPHSVAGLVSSALGERYRSDAAFAAEVQQLFGARPDLVDRVFSTTTGWRQILDVGPAPAEAGVADAPSVPTGLSGPQYAALRAARHLSLRDAADAVTELDPEVPVTDDHIRRLEAGGTPRVARVRSRLDVIYRADGRSCVEPITLRRDPTGRRWILEFPDYWIGPVWLQVDGPPDTTADAVLEWAHNYVPLRVHPGRVLTCRRAFLDAPPARLSLPPNWSVTAAGVGAREHAADVNWGWYSTDGDDIDSPAVNEHFLALFGRDLHDLERFIAASPHAAR